MASLYNNGSALNAVGDRFIMGLRPGLSLDPLDLKMLGELRPAGVIVFKDNFDQESTYETMIARFTQLMTSVRQAIGRAQIFVGIDHEGGRVFRLPPPFTNFGYANEWAPFAAQVGAAYGAELSSLGVNLNFAPVLDIHSNPDNPVIGQRALDNNEQAVALAAKRFIAAQNTHGVQSCGKHFPGHGDTATDSHYALPVIQRTMEGFRERELEPFRQAIAMGLGMVMSAHLMIPALDPVRPTTASAKLGRVMLRGELKFNGVYTTDDLGMNAAQPLLDDPEAVIDIARAGHDLFMMCSAWINTERVYAFAEHLAGALKSGALSELEWRTSGERIRALLVRTAQSQPRLGDPIMFSQHQKLADEIRQHQSR